MAVFTRGGMVVLNPNKSLVLNKNRVNETTRSDGEAMGAQWVLGTIRGGIRRSSTRADTKGRGGDGGIMGFWDNWGSVFVAGTVVLNPNKLRFLITIICTRRHEGTGRGKGMGAPQARSKAEVESRIRKSCCNPR